jgi:hypothetical protein
MIGVGMSDVVVPPFLIRKQLSRRNRAATMVLPDLRVHLVPIIGGPARFPADERERHDEHLELERRRAVELAALR